MNKTTVTVDQLLENQAQQGLRATVEAVDNHKEQVKITPFLAGRGCQCHMGIRLPKDTIQSLTITGETHQCCGKVLQVVEVHFKKGSGIALTEILQQLVANVAPASLPKESSGLSFRRFGHQVPFSPGSMSLPERCRTQYMNCLANAQDDFDICMCHNHYCVCTGTCRLQHCPPPSF
jgi:hypothetical protein